MKASERLAELAKKSKTILPDLASAGAFNFLVEGKESVPSIIKRRTRLGRGVSDSGELETLKALSPKYVERRKKIKLSENAKPKKSNLTLTGSMLDSINGFRRGTTFIFSFFGGTDKPNDVKARYARENGRPFFKLSTTETNGIARKIKSIISKALRQL